MAELLLELFSEEIPAGMQPAAALVLDLAIQAKLKAARIEVTGVSAVHVTPRRLVFAMDGIAAGSPDQIIERRGPRIDAPEKARAGFLQSLGTADYQLGEIEDKKGRFLTASYTQKGRSTVDVLVEAIPDILAHFPWPKSMRWGTGEARWVRPLQSILCLFDGSVVPVTFAGIEAGRRTFGHRFMAPDAFDVRDFADYQAKLAAAHVVLSADTRRRSIETRARELAASVGCSLREDPTLLGELAGLVEWPVPLLGRIDQAFMSIPPEVLVSTMRANQKYLALEDSEGRLAPFFITVANIAAPDDGRAIIAGNERVLRARLWDAKFFWEQDQKTPLEAFLPRLDAMVFHAELGTMREKVNRLETLAVAIAERIPGADRLVVERAARLAKADLVSGMVGEFPEVQGIMGSYYAEQQGEPAPAALAIAEHYRPLGPADACPTAPTSVAVALADKLDTLTGFFAAGIRPTGSGDPFALRRAALGVIRLVTENGLRLDLARIVETALQAHGSRFSAVDPATLAGELRAFFIDRLKVQAKARGVRNDLIEAVFSGQPDGDLVRVLARVAALQRFLETDDGQNLLIAYRRAANIVRIAREKDEAALAGPIEPALLREPDEIALHAAIVSVQPQVRERLALEDFSGAMQVLAELRQPVDRFFDQVMVNVEDTQLRHNRLRLLATLEADLIGIANFAVIEDRLSE